MIRNYCTTVLLIWFQGGFYALLYSFHFSGLYFVMRVNIFHVSAVIVSVHKGELYSMPQLL